MNGPLRVLLVGPLPPPSGGMANQTRQLKRLLEGEGVAVSVAQTNAPYCPTWIEKLSGLRAVFRLIPYLWRLAAKSRQADVVHVMANSGWSWHLFAAPAVWIARLRRTPVVVNYRGGLAGEFLERQTVIVRATLRHAAALVVPSGFLQHVFARYGMPAQIIPNIVDVSIFQPGAEREHVLTQGPHIVVARNLERLYGNDVALRAFGIVKRQFSAATLSVAGSGPELDALQALADELQLSDAIRFTGRLEVDAMVALYRSADLVVNPSRADNTPNSILEALACGVPVISTDVGGVPFLVEHGRTAWLVPPDAPEEMAACIVNVVQDADLRRSMRANGLVLANGCTWPVVRDQWLALYRAVAGHRNVGPAPTQAR